MPDHVGEARRGAVAMLPLIAGYAPFAFVVGSVLGAHANPLPAWSGIWLIFGGSAHLATIRGLDDASLLAAIGTGLLVNARLLVYSASLGRLWGTQPRWFRLTAAALVIDPTWLAAERRGAEPGSDRAMRRYFFGAGLTLGVAWCALVTVGMVAGDRAASWIDLEVTVPLCLVALVGPRLLEREGRVTVLVAAAAAAATVSFPAGSGLLIAIGLGLAAGLATSRRTA
jgi:predicted branched-subunit amino acid permease